MTLRDRRRPASPPSVRRPSRRLARLAAGLAAGAVTGWVAGLLRVRAPQP